MTTILIIHLHQYISTLKNWSRLYPYISIWTNRGRHTRRFGSCFISVTSSLLVSYLNLKHIWWTRLIRYLGVTYELQNKNTMSRRGGRNVSCRIITEFDFLPNSVKVSICKINATGATCQQRTLTPPDTRSCPTLGLACVLISRPISPELVLFPDFWVSNIPRYFSFAPYIGKKSILECGT